MNYEEKYKQALERARQVQTTNVYENKKSTEYIFPELSESEDERIRKELIERFNWELKGAEEQDAAGCSRQKDIAMFKRGIAWLEKQVPINEEAEKEKNDYVSGQFLYCKGSFNEFKEGESYWIEYIGNDTYIGRSDNILNQKFHITPRQLYTWLDPRHPEKQNEQKPSWSEEDSKNLNSVKWIIENSENLNRVFETIDSPEYIKKYFIDWLKSLKSNHWKPSEEQMKALNAINIFGELSYVGQGGMLVKLYNDLKKL